MRRSTRSLELAVGRVMPVLTIEAGLSMVPLAVLGPSGATRGLAIGALGLWIAVIVVTLVFNSPVNAEAVNWDPAAPPVDWEAQRDGWHLGQSVRTPLAVASFLCLGSASQWDRLWS